jgi:dihydrodipicolinate synthase/N-acetylneuraminate lyase
MLQGCPQRGVIPPVATPLTRAGDLDRDALRNLVERMVRAGVDGLFALGTTGEGPSLPYAMRYDIVEEVCTVAGGRVPVLVGVTDTVLEEALRLARHAHRCGAGAIVAAPPHYFTISQQELEGYMRRLAERSPLPLYLYNFPALTKVRFELETLRALARLPNVVGFKDSSGDLDYFRAAVETLAGVKKMAVFMGPEELLTQGLRLGGSGGVTGGANLFPELFVELYRAAVEGRAEDEARLQARLMQISEQVYGLGGYGSGFLRGLKAALWVCGLCENVLAPPHMPLDGAACDQVRERLQALGLLTHEGEPALHL